MHFLVLAADYPPSTRQPGSPRLYNICKQLAVREHRLTLFLLKPTPGRRAEFEADNREDRVFHAVHELPQYDSRRGSILPWVARRIWQRLSFAPNYSRRILAPDYVEEVRGELAGAISNLQVDCLYLDGISGFQYCPRDISIPVAIDLCDCISWLVAQLSRREKNLTRRVALFLEAQSVRREERSALASTALQLAISPVDAASFKSIYSQSNLIVVSNGVDSEYFAYEAPSSTSHTIVFTGVMGYQPNTDAAIYCAQEIFPKIRQRFPDARLLLVGADPPPSVLRLGEQPGVVVTGAVPDVRPYLRESAVFVCPLRLGAGVKNKLLAAMAMGLPVVANELSLSGIDTKEGEHVLVAGSAEDFSEKICSLFVDNVLARELSENSRRLVEEKYGWVSQIPQLESAMLKVVHAEQR